MMENEQMKQGEILLYSDGSEKEFVSVIFAEENFWLSQNSMAELFGCTPENIIQHLKNIYTEEELEQDATTKKYLVVRKEGNRAVRRSIEHYNLDAFIAVDYAELMAEDEQLMSMQDWLSETDRFLTNNRRNVLDGKGNVSKEAAAKKVDAIYEEFRKKQDAAYISEFDRQMEKYLKGK